MPVYLSRRYAMEVEGGPAAGHSPNDSTRYYIGRAGGLSPTSTTPNSFEVVVPEDGVVRSVRFDVLMVAGTTPSTNLSTCSLVRNAVPVATISNALTMSSLLNTAYNDNMAVPVAFGDRLEIQIQTPTWSTNPTVVFYRGTIIVEAGL